MLKKVLLASAMTLAFSVPAMAQDAAAGCASCGIESGAASPRAESKPIRLAQLTPRNLGPAQQIDMPRQGNGITVCCPPISNLGYGNFRIHQLPGKNASQTYGVTFIPAPGLDSQMQAFTPFAGLFVPSGLYGNSVMLDAEMKMLDPTIYPATVNPQPTSSAFGGGSNVSVKQHALRAWWIPNYPSLAPSGVWNGPHTAPANVAGKTWEKTFEDGVFVGAPLQVNHMAPNKWYMVKLSLKIAMKNRPHGTQNDPSWIVQDLNCSNAKPKYYRIMVSYAGNLKTTGAQAGPQLRIEEAN